MKSLNFRQKIIKIEALEKLVKKDYFTLSLTLTRIFLALCTLTTLIFNTNLDLLIQLNNAPTGFSLNIFQIFNNLYISRVFCYTILALVIVGVYPRIIGILHSWVAYSFLLSSKLIEGGDQVVHIVTLLLIPILIFDNRSNHWKCTKISNNFYKNTILFFADLLIKIQFFVIYFFASVGKFNSIEWKNGTALYYWFSDSVFGLNDSIGNLILPLLKNAYVLSFSTWLVLFVELLIAYAVISNSKKYKQIMFLIALFFHFFIGLFFGLWSFYFAMIAILSYTLFNSFNINYDSKVFTKS